VAQVAVSRLEPANVALKVRCDPGGGRVGEVVAGEVVVVVVVEVVVVGLGAGVMAAGVCAGALV
jgi:hypothetical protein